MHWLEEGTASELSKALSLVDQSTAIVDKSPDVVW